MDRVKAFIRGMLEFRSELTWVDPNRNEDIPGDYTELDLAYDRGREIAHRFTFRCFDY